MPQDTQNPGQGSMKGSMGNARATSSGALSSTGAPISATPKQNTQSNSGQQTRDFDRIKGKIRETWSRLTDDEVDLYQSNPEQFYGKLHEKYGLVKEETLRRLKEIEEMSKLTEPA